MTNLVRFPALGLEFELNRVAFSIGDFNFYWYGLLIAMGLLLAMAFAMRQAKDFGIDPDRMVDVIFIGVVAAIVCARAYYVAFAPFEYESIAQMINLRDGGLAIYGGVIGAFVFGGLACRWRKVPMFAMFDLTSMGFLIGQAIGRWGNFFNQEAFGTNTSMPWGMISESTTRYLTSVQQSLAEQGVTVDPNMPVHPTFLYESIWCLIGFFVLYKFKNRRQFDGELALMYAIWYGAGRAVIEGLRTDSLYIGNTPLRMSQLLAIVSMVAAAITLAQLRKRFKRKPVELAVDRVARLQKEELARQQSLPQNLKEEQKSEEASQKEQASKEPPTEQLQEKEQPEK
ncbi:MAG: prolipoprotein diacylglyceryl transferase [Pygmaiobacter massiliensis]|nr:prolipoprotein diacylglyceryl transferase [Pygmaiobacter massiliensis]